MSVEENLKKYQDIMSRIYIDLEKKEQTLDNADRLDHAVYGMLSNGNRTEEAE